MRQRALSGSFPERAMQITELPLAGAKLIQPRVFRDPRGFFFESYSAQRYREAGMPEEWVQDNHSLSSQGTLRGLHYQSVPGQAKLVRVTRGRIFDAIVDIRPSSATFGQWHGAEIDADDHNQLYVPIGFAHGFCVLSEVAEVQYKVSAPYDAAHECAIRWNDPEIGVAWPIPEPLLSDRDQKSESFAAFKARLGNVR
jgi:dTDP-4-dehydrorhamnose 3,5-epimerase